MSAHPLTLRLRAHALQALADVAGEAAPRPAEASEEAGGWRVTLTVAPAAAEPPSPRRLAAALEHCWLTAREMAALTVLLEHGARLTLPELLPLVEQRLGGRQSQSALKHVLERLKEAGCVSNERSGPVRGYQLTAPFLAHLASLAPCAA